MFAEAVAANLNTSADVLARLAGDDVWQVREAAAANLGLPADLLVVLAGDSEWLVRVGVAANPNTPPEVLSRLGQDYWAVRRTVAGNPGTPVDVLILLAEDDDLAVREAVAANVRLPSAVLDRLAADFKWEVREAAAEAHTRREGGTGAGSGVDACPADWSDDDEDAARSRAATSPDTSGGRLAELAFDDSWEVRVLAAANPNLPVATLAALASDADVDVRAAAQENVATRLAVPSALRGDGADVLAGAWLEHLTDNVDPELRVALVCAVADPGRRTGHVLAYGPDWEAALGAFRDRYGDVYDPAPGACVATVQTRRRAPRDASARARGVL